MYLHILFKNTYIHAHTYIIHTHTYATISTGYKQNQSVLAFQETIIKKENVLFQFCFFYFFLYFMGINANTQEALLIKVLLSCMLHVNQLVQNMGFLFFQQPVMCRFCSASKFVSFLFFIGLIQRLNKVRGVLKKYPVLYIIVVCQAKTLRQCPSSGIM